MWFLQELDPSSAAYNEGSLIRLQGPVTRAALERGLGVLVRRHTALRTSFDRLEGTLLQRLHEPLSVQVVEEDLAGLPAAAQRPAMDARVAQEIDRPFDLARPPLIRFHLFRLEGEQHLLVVAHHIITDGWSFTPIFNPDLLAVLEAELGHPLPARFGEPPLQYTDFAHWQQEQLRGPLYDRQLEFWKKRLAELPPLQLPLDRPRPPALTSGGATLETPPVPRALADAARKLAATENVTFFMLLEAVFKVMLHLYSRQTDLAVGATFAARSKETDGIFGCFTNTLVLRTDLSGNPTFRELLRRVRQADLEAYSHAAIPFDRVVAAVHPRREPGRLPLFDVLFDLRGRHNHGQTANFTLRSEPVLPTSPKCDLAFAFVDDAGELSCSFIYARDLFDRPTVERMAAHLERILALAVQRPDARLEELLEPTAGEREEWTRLNATAAPVEDSSLHGHFEAWAQRTPDAPAVDFLGEVVSYRQLNARAELVAGWMRERGLGPETPVAVCLPRGPDQVAAALGALKAGGAYLPLDPNLPPQRLAFILDDARAPFLVTTRELQDALEISAPFTLFLEEVPADATLSSAPPPAAVSSRQLAYLIYTSGSTGRPKGVLVEHGNATNTLAEALRTSGAGPGDRILQFASPGFDVAIKETFTALGSGATLVMAPKEELLPGPPLTQQIVSRKVTHLILTPQVLGGVEEALASTVRHVVVGGEPCPPLLLDRWAPGREFVSEYGPTEAAITSTQARCTAGTGRPPLGRPTLNVQAYVLDEQLRPLPTGVPGELYLGGAGVARGYLGRPELTAEKFVPDPFSPLPGARLYRTGDRVRLQADGQLGFVGRVDDQVKIRGHRVELGEIEEALRRRVPEAVVVVREDGPGPAQLVGYVVSAPGPAVDPRTLREQLAAELPEYMVPSAIVPLERLPLNPSGKVDKAALPAPQRSGATPASGAPADGVETALAEIWAELLGTPISSREDSFFDLGGHSLLVPQVVAAVAERLGVELPIRAVFEHETLAALAAVISALAPGGPAPAPRLEHLPRGGTPRASLQQQALVRLLESGKDPSFYTVVDAYRVPRRLERGAVASAWSALLQRHDVLRQRFPGGPESTPVLDPPRPELGWHDLGALPPAEAEARLEALLESVSGRGFPPAEGGLLRLEVADCGPRGTVLILLGSQLVTDAASMDVLFEELLALCAPAAHLPPPEHQYADYAAWQQQRLEGEGLEREVAFWRGALAAPPTPLALPYDRPAPAAPTVHTGMTGRVNLDPAVAAAFRAVCAQEGTTSFVGFTAAFAAFLRAVTGQAEIRVGAPVQGRTPPLARTVGFFINVVTLPLQPGEAASFRSLVRGTRDWTREALSHAELPMEVLAQRLGRTAHFGHAAWYEALVTQHVFPLLRDPEGAAISRLRGRTGAAKCALSLRAFDDQEGLGTELEFDSDRLEPTTAAALASRFQTLLQALVLGPDQSLGRLLER